MVHAGNLVRANDTTPLVVINQLSPINVSFAIPEAQLAALKQLPAARALSRVEVAPPSDAQVASTGRVTFVDNSVDPTTGTIKVKGSFPNTDHRLWPGQFVNVVLTLATDPDAIVVPTAAVQSGQDGQYVFVVKHGSERRTAAGPGRAQRPATKRSSTKGSQPDEVVVTDGQLRLVPGSRSRSAATAERSGS